MYFFFVNLIILGVLAMLSVISFRYNGKRISPSPKLLAVLGLSYLCFLSMFRGVSVGNDTYEYATYFARIAGQSHILSYIRAARFEPGYILLNWLLSRFTDNYQVLFVLTSLFSYFSAGRFLLRRSKFPAISVYFFFTLMTFDFFLSGIRQELAIAILLFAYDDLLERRPFRYAVLVAAATMFHYTALLYLPIYVLTAVRPRKKYLDLLLLVTAVLTLGFNFLLTLALRFFPSYSSYLGKSYFESGVKSSVILYFTVYICFLLAGEAIGRSRGTECPEADELDWRLTLLLPATCLISFNAPIFTRILRYFQLHIFTYFPNALVRKAGRQRWILLLITMLATAVYAFIIHLLRTPTWYSTYPYSFFWSN